MVISRVRVRVQVEMILNKAKQKKTTAIVVLLLHLKILGGIGYFLGIVATLVRRLPGAVCTYVSILVQNRIRKKTPVEMTSRHAIYSTHWLIHLSKSFCGFCIVLYCRYYYYQGRTFKSGGNLYFISLNKLKKKKSLTFKI